MPNIVYRDWVRDDSGAGIENVRVRAYELLNSGAVAGTHTYEDFTDENGKFEIIADSAQSESGMFVLEIFNSLTGETFIRRPDIALQLDGIVGAGGAAPIADGSITDAKLAVDAVSTGKIQNDAVTDPKIGNRTVNDTSVPSTDTAQIGTLISNLANRIKAITGEASWRDDPADTIASIVAGGGGGVATELDLPQSTVGFKFAATTAISGTLSSSMTSLSGTSISIGPGYWLIFSNIEVGNTNSEWSRVTMDTFHSVSGDINHPRAVKNIPPLVGDPGFEHPDHVGSLHLTQLRLFTSSGTLSIRASASGGEITVTRAHIVAIKIS